MFETFGLEEKIHRSFIRHFKEFVKSNEINALQKEFELKKSVYVGSSVLGNSIKPIIEKYGEPKIEFPKRLDFILMNRNHLSAGTSGAFFLYYQNRFIIGKVLNNISDFYEIKDFEYSISHELQHFLTAIYTGETSPKYALEPRKTNKFKRYYGDEWEVRSYSTVIALKAINTINDTYEFRTRKMDKLDPERAKILDKMSQNRMALLTSYINANLQSFFAHVEEKKKKKMPDDIKQAYYLATVGNFKRLFDKWIEDKKTELNNA